MRLERERALRTRGERERERGRVCVSVWTCPTFPAPAVYYVCESFQTTVTLWWIWEDFLIFDRQPFCTTGNGGRYKKGGNTLHRRKQFHTQTPAMKCISFIFKKSSSFEWVSCSKDCISSTWGYSTGLHIKCCVQWRQLWKKERERGDYFHICRRRCE